MYWILLGSAGHLVLAAQRQDLHETNIEEQAFHDAGKHDQAAQQLLVVFRRAGLEIRVGQHIDKGQQELVLVADAGHFVVHIEHFALVQPQTFHDVLVSMGMDGLFKGLAQQILPAFRVRNVAIGAQRDIVCGQAVGGAEKSQIAHHQAALVVGQAIGILPQSDVRRHIDLLRHPVIGTTGEVFLPCPFVLERHQLVHVGTAIDDALVFHADTPG